MTMQQSFQTFFSFLSLSVIISVAISNRLCGYISSLYWSIVLKVNFSLNFLISDSCQAKPMNYFDLFSNKRQTTCDVTFAGESPETDDTIVDLLKNDSNVTTVGEQIFVIASKMLVRVGAFCS